MNCLLLRQYAQQQRRRKPRRQVAIVCHRDSHAQLFNSRTVRMYHTIILKKDEFEPNAEFARRKNSPDKEEYAWGSLCTDKENCRGAALFHG